MKFFWSILLASLLYTNHVQANILSVGPSGDYASIEAASMVAVPGDTIMVEDGTYYTRENLTNLQGTSTDTIYIITENIHQVIYQGNSEAWHITDGAFLKIIGFIFEQQTSNGVNIDDGGSYDTPSHNIVIEQCIFRDMNVSGNHDLLKMSGVDHFTISNCQFINGSTGGSGIDMVGCHHGLITSCVVDGAGVSGIQAKGGTQFIRIEKNTLKNMPERALNLGGSTGLTFFRPPLPNPITGAFEAADLDVYSNVFIGSRAPIAYVGSVRVRVYNNTIYYPDNWVMRILQETTESGFLACGDNEFKNNIVYLDRDLTEVNIGPNTSPATFQFSNNLWFNEDDNGSWAPVLPVTDVDQVIDDPLFIDAPTENFRIPPESPAVQKGLNTIDPTTDFDHTPYTLPRSIGAFEGFDIALPVEYLAFDAKQVNQSILIKWVVGFNLNTKHFKILRSTDLEHWASIGFKKDAEDDNVLSFFDTQPVQGINYYKVIAVDTDGTETRSPIVSVLFKLFNPQVYLQDGHLQIHFPNQNEFWVEIFNTAGQQITMVYYERGSLSHSLPLDHLNLDFIIVRLTSSLYTRSFTFSMHQ